jgi:hypothetical protein
MSINKYIKEKSIYFVCTLIVVIVLSVTSSFAFVNNDTNKVLDNGLRVKYKDINKTSMLIEKKITITNTESVMKPFNLYVSSLDDDTTISLDKVYYSINDGVESLLKNNNNSSIYRGILDKNESIELKIKFWVSYDLLDNSDQGKNLSINLNIQ